MIIKEFLKQILLKKDIDIDLAKSNRLDISDFASNDALKLAKQMGKKPIDIANEIKQKCDTLNVFETVSVDGPGFLNFKLSNDFWQKQINLLNEDNIITKQLIPQKIVVDYGGPNIAKPLHVGHLRSAVVGESIKRILRSAGNEVVADIHLGDWGLQMGLVFVGLEIENIDENKIDMEVLNWLYPKYSALSKNDENLLKRAQEYTYALQNGDEKLLRLWKICYEKSVEAITANYEKLDISFDVFLGESDAHATLIEMAETEKNKFRLDDGAYVIDIKTQQDKKEIPPVLFIKSNGSYGYHATDIATIKNRIKNFNPDKIIYITDNRQALHFEQVFRASKKLGIVSPDYEFIHVGFGTMNGVDGKPFKTRDGGVVALSDMIKMVERAGYEKIKMDKISSETQRQNLALNIGVAALKFGDLSNTVTSDYVFDLEYFTSFEGKTGPYIQYSAVRIKSMLEKVKPSSSDINLYNEYDLDLAKSLLGFDDAYQLSLRNLEPHHICLKVYEIAQKFNTFYHFCHILNETDNIKKDSWINLSKKTYDVFETATHLIGFKLVDKM